MRHSIEESRLRYAEELRFTAKVGSRAVVKAFASVPRERFLGPGPWRVLSPMALGQYWTMEDADPRHLYFAPMGRRATDGSHRWHPPIAVRVGRLQIITTFHRSAMGCHERVTAWHYIHPQSDASRPAEIEDP